MASFWLFLTWAGWVIALGGLAGVQVPAALAGALCIATRSRLAARAADAPCARAAGLQQRAGQRQRVPAQQIHARQLPRAPRRPPRSGARAAPAPAPAARMTRHLRARRTSAPATCCASTGSRSSCCSSRCASSPPRSSPGSWSRRALCLTATPWVGSGACGLLQGACGLTPGARAARVGARGRGRLPRGLADAGHPVGRPHAQPHVRAARPARSPCCGRPRARAAVGAGACTSGPPGMPSTGGHACCPRRGAAGPCGARAARRADAWPRARRDMYIGDGHFAGARCAFAGAGPCRPAGAACARAGRPSQQAACAKAPMPAAGLVIAAIGGFGLLYHLGISRGGA
jgi:hypothetical protein